MKHIKRLSALFIVLAAIFCLSLSVVVSADENSTVTLRIEGINANLYYAEVELGDAETVTDVIIAADAASESLTVTGAAEGYITDVNGDTAGKFGGWDGWLYRVNDTEPSVAMGEYSVKAGDVIVLYYGDPYGAGMQYPIVNTDDIENGVIRFTSMDTVYDEEFNATTSENPIVGATVTFGSTEYTTDEDGKITVDESLLVAGTHKLAISKTSETGIPLVLRLAPDAAVVIEGEPDVSNTSVPADNSATSDASDDEGDNTVLIVSVVIIVVLAAVIVVFVVKRKK